MKRACILTLGLVISAGPGLTQTAEQTCNKMRSDGRLGPITYTQCLCNYAAADRVLDDDVKALLFDAWRTGANNMGKVEALKPQSRIRKQFKTLERTIKASCQ